LEENLTIHERNEKINGIFKKLTDEKEEEKSISHFSDDFENISSDYNSSDFDFEEK
jgi:hypothetical protein